MNILMIVSWYTPMHREKLEAGVFHYEQAMDLKKYCNVALYYPFDQEIPEAETAGEEWGLMTYRSRYLPKKVLAAKKQMRLTMARIRKEFQPDLLHAHGGGAAGYYAVEFSKKYHLPLVVTEHSPLELSRADKFGVARYFAKTAYRNSAANICVSEDSRQKLSRLFPDCPFEVIYNGITLPKFDSAGSCCYRAGFTNIVIVAVLYDPETKGLRYLLEAMRILKEQGRPFFLHHIGGGEYLGHFMRLARELGVEDVCEFHGQCDREQLYRIVDEMDFFVSASLFECSGVSVQEAMLLGKPVLGTNSGGVDSLVPDFAGRIVEKANAQALADGIAAMGQRLSSFDTAKIREYALQTFEIGHISRQYLTLYENILAGGGVKPA